MFVSEIYSIRDAHWYNSCATNSVESYFNVPSAVSSSSIYGFNSDGWKFGNASSYSRIIYNIGVSPTIKVYFTPTEQNGQAPLFFFYQGTSAVGISYNGYWIVGGSTTSSSIQLNKEHHIEVTSNTIKLYCEDTLIGSNTHSIGNFTTFEMHTSSGRYCRLKDLTIL